LTFDLLTLKVVSESRMTWATSVPVIVFLRLSVLELGRMYAPDRQTDVRQKHRLMPPPCGGGGIINYMCTVMACFWVRYRCVDETYTSCNVRRPFM